MDVVLRAYGRDDLADTAAPEFLTEDTEQDHRYQDRLFWLAPSREVVLPACSTSTAPGRRRNEDLVSSPKSRLRSPKNWKKPDRSGWSRTAVERVRGAKAESTCVCKERRIIS